MSNHEHDHCGCGCEHHDHNHEEPKLQMDKYMAAISQSNVTTDDAAVAAAVQEIIDKHAAENNTAQVQQFLLNCVDLTTLATDDSERSVAQFVQKVNDFDENYPMYTNVAAVCVYSNFAAVVRGTLEVTGVDVAVCSASFPSSQAHIETKIAETALAVADGADEVDIVFNVGYYKDGAYEELADEIAEIKHVLGERPLKVILETGLLKTAKDIRNASILSMYSGCDFIKTSTGKVYSGATLEAAYVMCQCIKEYYEKFGRMVGFKASGGIRTTEDAVKYYTIVKEVLGEQWLNNTYFRIGASSLANALFQSFTGSDTKPF